MTELHTTGPPAPVIRVEGLTKQYGDRLAVDSLSFDVPRGVVAGFIGPNGAGKTTTLAMLLGLVAPSGGGGEVLGVSLDRPAEYLPRVGALIETPSLYPGLTGVENLRVLAALGDHDRTRIPVVIDQVGLAGRGEDRFGTYSLGMKQRLGIAAALLGDPELLVLDEPTNGLDPVGIREIRTLVASLTSEGRTVLVSSHLLGEVEQICDHLVIIEAGAGVYSGPTAGFRGGAGRQLQVVPEHDGALVALADVLRAAGYDLELAADRPELLVELGPGDDERRVAAAVNRQAHEHGIVVAGLHPHQERLEDRYLSLVAGGAR
ncbi:ABC transporter ATP-binding protein [Dermatobacter hominis]|uniref:ABC transporter ATP-binding protein n=1 Tax=Dermatobacter hominis TaxID=2884263 RepID=UPI001D125970|nr:ATP-binding cassette domain-containing protein [Dermatobacter hominis]UDY37429.1 ATP-binding cassette domain-containing protein [Dermatobacter hominis]